MAVCYRHPRRDTGVSCSNCGRSICTDCMTPTPVGMRCPECSKQKTKIIRGVAGPLLRSRFTVTQALIGLNVLAFMATVLTGAGVGAESTSGLIADGAIWGPAIAYGHEYWRLVTGGFLHTGILHLAFNMFFLYVLGGMLESLLGTVRFFMLYMASLLAGSFGAVLLSPMDVTVGASGAIFGLMAAALIEVWSRGENPLGTSLGLVVILNIAITFVIPGISIGGHVGGLIGGAMAAGAIEVGRRVNAPFVGIVGTILVAAASVGGAIVAAGRLA